MNLRRYFQDSFNYHFGIYALLMSFNSVMLFGVNISLLLFVYMVIIFSPQIKIFNINTFPQFMAIIIFLMVCISMLDINTGPTGLSRSLAVLPNYLYWCLLTILTVNMRFKINWDRMGLPIAAGLVLTLVFYQFGDFDVFNLLKNNSPNSYSFILVCFSAISVKAVQQRYGTLYALILLGLLLWSLISVERRAGFVLVLLSSTAALSFRKANAQYLVTPLAIAFILFVTSQISFVEEALLDASPRIHELIYETDKVSTTDQSYLTRKLMIERGLKAYRENPVTGVGINNYGMLSFEDEGDFEGADLVMHKAAGRKLSAHNSYILLLVEGGLLLLVPVLIMFLYNVINFVQRFNQRTSTENAFYWSFLAMICHLYMISEIVNVYAWFLLAVVTALSVRYNSFLVNPVKRP